MFKLVQKYGFPGDSTNAKEYFEKTANAWGTQQTEKNELEEAWDVSLEVLAAATETMNQDYSDHIYWGKHTYHPGSDEEYY